MAEIQHNAMNLLFVIIMFLLSNAMALFQSGAVKESGASPLIHLERKTHAKNRTAQGSIELEQVGTAAILIVYA